MSEIHVLPPPVADTEVRDSVIRLLKNWLADAEAGRVDVLVIVGHYLNGEWRESASSTDHFTEVIGQLEILKQSWVADYVKRRDHG